MVIAASTFFSMPVAPSPAVEAEFFTGLKTGNATFKKTSAGRFKQLDAALVRHLAVAGSRQGELLDIGISSGMTTLELDAALTAAGHALRITGTDLSLDAYIVALPRGCRALVDANGHPLQYEVGGYTIRPWRRRLDYVDGMIVVRPLINCILGPRARKALAAEEIVQKVELISPRLKQRRDITVLADDITVTNAGFAGRFDVVRAANILNRDYFSEATLRRALGNVATYLAGPGSLLLVARTLADDQHHGTLFELGHDGERFNIVDRFGNGSEIEALVLDSRLPAAA